MCSERSLRGSYRQYHYQYASIHVGRNLWICDIHGSACAIDGSIVCAEIHGYLRNLWIMRRMQIISLGPIVIPRYTCKKYSYWCIRLTFRALLKVCLAHHSPLICPQSRNQPNIARKTPSRVKSALKVNIMHNFYMYSCGMIGFVKKKWR